MFVILKYVVFALTLSMLLWGIFSPHDPSPAVNVRNLDKIMHFSAFIFFGLTAIFAFAHHMSRFYLFIVLILIAMSLEFLQPIMQPARQFSLGDLFANVTGIFIAIFLYAVYRIIRYRKI